MALISAYFAADLSADASADALCIINIGILLLAPAYHLITDEPFNFIMVNIDSVCPKIRPNNMKIALWTLKISPLRN